MSLVPVALLAAALLGAPADSVARTRAPADGVHNGRRGELEVGPPRVEAEVRVDGVLDEPVWTRAARLTGFSQFQPSDGAAARDSTEVLVWYSPTAIHFGIRAFAPTGTVNATLADRDRITSDDYVTILLSTFDDARQALAFAVNPLGVQMDGTLVETGNVGGGGFQNNTAPAREPIDLSADFVYQSKGRVTPAGYEVEMRIPFKSLRYQPSDVQRWGIHVLRRVQRLGVEDSWAPAARGRASFLAQGGRLVGLTDLRRGLVLDLTPTVTQRSEGAPVRTASLSGTSAQGPWDYRVRRPELGGNVRWGVTNNLTLNGTVHPDFSQVEADAAQVQFDPRSALFFAERRPFFLDGIEQFSVPNGIIYTRRIVQPAAAAKLTGKVAGTDVAVLSAVDDPGLPRGVIGRSPVFNIVRVQRDLGAQSRLGVVVTDREAQGTFNRVAGADVRVVIGKVYSLQGQIVGSATRDVPTSADGAAPTRTGPLWQASLARNGRRFGFRYNAFGVDPDFVAGSGFISRGSIARVSATHRGTVFNRPGSAVQSYSGEVVLDGTWKYRDFTAGNQALEKKLHVNTSAQLRGGWSAGASTLIEEFRYDPDLYASYYVARPRAGSPGVADTVRYTGTASLPNLDWVLSLNTPQFRRFSGNAFVVWGRDENFLEWSSSDILFFTLAGTIRPTERLRIDANYQLQRYGRRSDGTAVAQRQIPRLKFEYQIARPVFVRFVGQYVAAQQDSLRDDSRTDAPVLFRTATGFVRAGAQNRNTFRGDMLFSYQPSPGTVFFAGYGSSAAEPDPLRFSQLRRTGDGFFLKLSYLFRV